MLNGTCFRGWAALVLLALLTPVADGAASALQAEMDSVLRSDPRNTGVLVSVSARGDSTLVYNLASVAPTNSLADVFRTFLQFANAEKNREFKTVELSARGRPKFFITGAYFKRLGQEYGNQNPVYTMRTFAENVMKLDGSRAFPTWTGGLLGVSSKQVIDFNEFHRQWWIEDLATVPSDTMRDANNVPAATPIRDTGPGPTSTAVELVSRRPSSSSVEAANSSPQASTAMDTPQWLGTFPGSREPIQTPSPGAIAVAYAAPAPSGDVVRFYRESFEHDGVAVRVAFNGVGTTIQAARDNESCVIRVADSAAGATVSALCAKQQGASTRATAAVAPPPLPAGIHRVEYSITGSAAAVGLTYKNATGGTEQRDVVLPGSLSFNSVAGQFVYISAQNKTNSGDVHVSITVDGRLLQEATSTTPFGIATASGTVPR